MFATKMRRELRWLAPPGSTFRFGEGHYRGDRETSKGRTFLGVLLSVLLLSGSVPGQSATSSVSGSVVDAQGKAVAGATVTLTTSETNAVRTATSAENGAFLFNLVPPGEYQLEASASGFKKAVITDVRALVAKPTNVTVELEVGGVSDTVTVSAGSAEVLINKRDASLGNNFVAQQITQLPLESRNVVGLLSLQPGVTRAGNVTGSRTDQGNITLDGVDVNEQQAASAFESILRVTPDSVQEFRVTTTNPNAAEGRSAGAQVALVTKSGTNQFHGSAYEFHRNTIFTANSFFNNKAGVFGANDPQVLAGLKGVGEEKLPRPKLIRNLFGGTIGGPIKKDRLFFFYNYEGRRDASEAAAGPVTVPLASLGRGEVKYLTAANAPVTLTPAQITQIFPAVGVNPAAIAILADAAKRYPANSSEVGDGLNTGGFRFNASTPARFSTHIARLDYNLTQDGHQVLFFRGNYQQDVVLNAPFLPDTPRPGSWNHPLGFALGHTWSIKNSLVNDLRFGLTRNAFSTFGDSGANNISFRSVFAPANFTRTFTRTNPTYNITDDLSWTHGSHSVQFGTNIRVIRNTRTSVRFDSALTNGFFYDQSGAVLTNPLNPRAGSAWVTPMKHALAAVIGRYSQYAANIDYNLDGTILDSGSPLIRTYATNEYDFYVQDSWKLQPNLTVTYGLRYGLSRPIYETHGFQAAPTVNLGEFLQRRLDGAAAGTPVQELITVDLAGPANDKPDYYKWDKNNFQPRIAVAWTPSFSGGWKRKVFGSEGDLVIRAGFAMLHDFLGQALATNFDTANTLGFSSSTSISANTFNVTTRPAPLFASFGQNIRALPSIPPAAALKFPQQKAADGSTRIESSLDSSIVWPEHYSWNVSVGRKLPGGVFVEGAYVGRAARKLLSVIDTMHFNNLVDKKSGMDWYTAAGKLEDARLANTPVNKIGAIPFFDNLFKAGPLGASLANDVFGDPAFLGLTPTQAMYYMVAREEAGGYNIVDWTFLQTLLDPFSTVGQFAFRQNQYGSLFTTSNFAESDYHALLFSVRQRYKETLLFDFNYTMSKSLDTASGTNTNAGLILNPIFPKANRGVSNFDVKHLVNVNAVWQLPFGKGRKFLGKAPGFVDAFLGGWQLTGIFRYNSGLPFGVFDSGGVGWATNWNFTVGGTRLNSIATSPTRGEDGKDPNNFKDVLAAYQSFRNARAGEVGDRNPLRFPGFVNMDAGLGKSFTMPYRESHQLQLRWEVFNVTNTQRLTGASTTSLEVDPFAATAPPANWGKFTEIQGSPRVMQIALKYTF